MKFQVLLAVVMCSYVCGSPVPKPDYTSVAGGTLTYAEISESSTTDRRKRSIVDAEGNWTYAESTSNSGQRKRRSEMDQNETWTYATATQNGERRKRSTGEPEGAWTYAESTSNSGQRKRRSEMDQNETWTYATATQNGERRKRSTGEPEVAWTYAELETANETYDGNEMPNYNRTKRLYGTGLYNLALDFIHKVTGTAQDIGMQGGFLQSAVVVEVVTPIVNALANPPDISPCYKGMGFCTSKARNNALGGSNIGTCNNCPNCLVCCKYTPPCGTETGEMITHFQSEGYPKIVRNPSSCSLSIKVRSEVCQVKLEFLDFDMPPPVLGSCDSGSHLDIFNPGMSQGIFGSGNNKMCGSNKYQHVHLDADGDSTIILKATSRTSQNSNSQRFRWNIVVTQIPCRDLVLPHPSEYRVKGASLDIVEQIAVGIGGPITVDIPPYYLDNKAPDDCRQFFTKSRGTISSFNYDGSAQFMTNQDYAICFKRQKDSYKTGLLCGIRFTANTFDIPASPNVLPPKNSVNWPKSYSKAEKKTLSNNPNCLTGGNIQPNPANPKGITGQLELLSPCCTGTRAISAASPGRKGRKDGIKDGIPESGTLSVNNPGSWSVSIDSALVPGATRYFYCGTGPNTFGIGNVLTTVSGELSIIIRVKADSVFPTTVQTGVLAAQCPNGNCVGFEISYDRRC